MYIKLGSTIRGTFGTSNFTTGNAQNADSPPVVTVLEQGTAMGYAPVVALKDTGLYEVEAVLSGGNGFEVGKEYSCYVTVVVGGITSRGPVVGLSSFNVTTLGPDDAVNATVTNISAIVAAILDELLTGHAVIGSVGDAIAIAAGLLQGNFFMDQTNNTNPNGQTAARMRIFRTNIAAAAATDGGVGEGEFATFVVTTTYSGPNKIVTHRVVRQ